MPNLLIQLVITGCMLLIALFSFAQTNTFPASGYVGIGTTTPQAKLEVDNTGANTAGLLVRGQSGDNWFPYTDGKNYIRGTTIIGDLGGNVGIGTNTPLEKLNISGGNIRLDVIASGNGIYSSSNDSNQLFSFTRQGKMVFLLVILACQHILVLDLKLVKPQLPQQQGMIFI